MPGCLGLDALWQLVGFFLGWSGFPGKGRALGAGEVKFTGEILPESKKVVYQLDISRVIDRKLVMGIADGTVAVDGKTIYTTKALKVGLFTPENKFWLGTSDSNMRRAVITGRVSFPASVTTSKKSGAP